MLNELLLLSGNDIPFTEAQLVIHQPTIKEIAYIGEDSFFAGCELLKFSKNNLPLQDRNLLVDKTDFDIIMSVIRDKSENSQKSRVNATMVLTLLFPEYHLDFLENAIILRKDNEVRSINNFNFVAFKEILISLFCLNGKNNEQVFNPAGDLARKIAEKIEAGRRKAAQDKGQNQKVALLSRYVSILAVGATKDMNDLLNYTIYQLFDEFNRFELKYQHDMYIKAKLAGAKDVKEVENWMKDLYSKD
jgi:hypothetical protein